METVCHIKTFDALTKNELYRLLQLRSAVFVVEQDCVYQDIDGKDQKALPLLCFHGEHLVGYTRIFRPGDYFQHASIGRVVVRETARKHGLGKVIMLRSIEFIEQELKENIETVNKLSIELNASNSKTSSLSKNMDKITND